MELWQMYSPTYVGASTHLSLPWCTMWQRGIWTHRSCHASTRYLVFFQTMQHVLCVHLHNLSFWGGQKSKHVPWLTLHWPCHFGSWLHNQPIGPWCPPTPKAKLMTHDWAPKGEIYEVKELQVSNDRNYPTNYIKTIINVSENLMCRLLMWA